MEHVKEKENEQEQERIRKIWYSYLTKGELPEGVDAPWWTSKKYRKFFLRLPANPRCASCYYPFEGVGGSMMRSFFGVKPSRMNPHFCNMCEQFAQDYQGGLRLNSPSCLLISAAQPAWLKG
jgi:hypothetical protein